MRKLIALGVTTLALAAPSAALATTYSVDFDNSQGANNFNNQQFQSSFGFSGRFNSPGWCCAIK